MADNVLFLTDDFIKTNKLINLEELIPVIEISMASASIGQDVVQPARTIMNIPSKNGVLLTMPSYTKYNEALACKIVTSYPKNVDKGLPTILATVLLLDSTTGKVLSVMDGNEITTWRTAAASVVATKYLSNESSVLAILGCGTQAKSHAEALDFFFKFNKIHIWNHRFEGAQEFAEELNKKGKVAKAFENGEECVKEADIIVTATYASSPILKRKWIKPGAHINAIGAGITHHGELDMEFYKSAKLYTDSMPSAKIELKGLTDNGIQILGEIGEVINGIKKVNRKDITIFQSLGMAVEDAVSAKLIYDKYQQMKQ